jgi:hypothetical protein
MQHAWKSTMVGIVMVLVVLTFGCSRSSNVGSVAEYEQKRVDSMASSADRGEMKANEAAMPAAPPAAEAPASSSVYSPGSAYAAQPSQQYQPQIIKTATVSLQVEDLPKSMKALEALTIRRQGIITNQYLSLTQGGSNTRSGSLEVRVPQQYLQEFLDALAGVGKVLSLQVTGTDVGTEIVDTDARVRNLKAQETALQGIMQRAGKIPDVLQVSQELARIRGEIEQAQSRLAYLRQQVAYSTVTLSVGEAGVGLPASNRPGLWNTIGNAFRQALDALYGFVLGLVQMLIWLLVYLLPIILVIALVVGLLWKFLLKGLATWGGKGLLSLFQQFRKPRDRG